MNIISPLERPGTRLYHDFLRRIPAIANRFAQLDADAEFLQRRASAGISRKRLQHLATTSLAPFAPSPQQQQSIDQLGDVQSTLVITGQQVGLFGGPMYTLLKIGTAVRVAAEWSAQFGTPVIPVYWLEDNDHDAKEASTVSLDGVTQTTFWDGSEERQPVSRRRFSTADVERIRLLIDQISGPFAEDITGSLRRIYSDDVPWADAMIDVLSPFLREWGVVVIRASNIIKEGYHAPLLQRLLDIGAARTLNILDTAAQRLTAGGYHVQIAPTTIPLFRLDDTGRHRIDDVESRRADIAAHPECYMPSALLRPILQDAVLPTAATVLGPAEVAYHAEMREFYAALGVDMPVPLPRHGLTLVDARTERNLGKEQRTAQDFFRGWSDLERQLVAELGDDVLPVIDEAPITNVFLPYIEAAKSIDPTLVATVESAATATRSSLENLSAKLRSALKKKNAQRLDRQRALHQILYPFDAPQERAYPVAYWQARFGSDALRIIVDTVTATPLGSHVVFGVSDLVHEAQP